MQDRTGNNEQTDRLAGYMKQRLDTHRLPVDEACWEEIERRLPVAPPLSRSYRPGWRAVAVAALFGGLIGLFFLPEVRRPQPTAGVVEKGDGMQAADEKRVGSLAREPSDGPNDGKSSKQTGGTDRQPKKEFVGEASAREGVQREKEREKGTGKGGGQKVAETTQSGIPVTGPARTEAVFSREMADVRLTFPAGGEDTAAVPASAKGALKAEEKKKAVSGPEEAPGTRSARIRFDTRPAAPTQKGWLLAVVGGAGVGAAGGLSSSGTGDQQNDMANDPLPPPDYKPLPPVVVPGESFSLEDYAEADYALPLSFGVMARKNFNDRLALESGLVYTYLSSRFAASGSLSRKARLELHYLGIPLNLVLYAWNHPRWNVYFTAGGMVEKGLKSLYTERVYREGQLGVLSRDERIGGVQWSVNFSAGAEYRFYKTWSFYLEPRLSRYFDTGQPASYRTAHAWSVGLSGGIRYAF